MRRYEAFSAVLLALALAHALDAQTTRPAKPAESRPGLAADPLSAMALPAPPEGVKVAKQPVVTIGRDRLETDDLTREIVAFYWARAVDVLVRRKIVDLELARRKVKLSEVDIEREAARLLGIADPQTQWSHLAMTNPQVAADLREQAHESLATTMVTRPPGAEDDEPGDAQKFQRVLDTKKLADLHKVRKRYLGDPLAPGIAADVTGPDGRIDAVLDKQVLEHLRTTIRYDELYAAREALIDDWLLGSELINIGQSITTDEINKVVAAQNEKHKPPFDYKMICQFKGTTPEKEAAMYRRLAAWKKITAFQAKPEELLRYAKHRETYYRGENRSVRQIFFRTTDALTGAPLDSGAQAQAAEEAKAAYDALNGGGDFSEVARTKSEDATTASGGGLVNQPFKRYATTAADQPLNDAVFGLSADAPLSKPVKGAKGWYVFKLEKDSPPNPKVKFENFADPNFADWISSDYERGMMAEYLASLRKSLDVRMGSDTTLTTGW